MCQSPMPSRMNFVLLTKRPISCLTNHPSKYCFSSISQRWAWSVLQNQMTVMTSALKLSADVFLLDLVKSCKALHCLAIIGILLLGRPNRFDFICFLPVFLLVQSVLSYYMLGLPWESPVTVFHILRISWTHCATCGNKHPTQTFSLNNYFLYYSVLQECLGSMSTLRGSMLCHGPILTKLHCLLKR